MEMFRLIRKTFAFIGFISGERIFRVQLCQTIVPIIILLILMAYESSCVVYFVRNLQIGDIENSLYAVLEASALTSSIGSFVTIMYHKKSVRKLIEIFQETFDKCNLYLKNKKNIWDRLRDEWSA